MKKIAVINDLSGLGRCSLTAAISVLSAMGVQACPLPTAVLTAQTEYPSYYCDDFTDKIDIYRQEWLKLNQHFDGIYTGYVASVQQIQQIIRFIDTFKEPDTFLLVDPVMGDDGQTYDVYTPDLLCQMKQLVSRADIITPNLTEFCLLTDMDYRELMNLKLSEEKLIHKLQSLSRTLCQNSEKTIIITGICRKDPDDALKIDNLYLHGTECSFTSAPYIGGSYSGTGDLFASCMAGGIARGDALPSLLRTTGEFLENSLKDSVLENIPYNDGVNYEKYLSILMPEIENV
ncbi:pyridoxamine kinase [Faecalicatena contorta]|uniref:pyridoxamine kinase n=1 Tax=Faecalicatena contorta TaxID=39482 RepID=UPI001F229F3B|nr:pyridoxamine kinase [Faecalicatena contorta]MCF2684082.1 pyridoxamine kinase [Faecalicatena contorta]